MGMVLVLAACTEKKIEAENESADKTETKDVKEINNEMNFDEAEENNEKEEDENNKTKNESIAASDDEDHFINGEVILEEEKNNIHIEGKTNLVEGTTLEANLFYNPFSQRHSVYTVSDEKVEIASDGSFVIDYEVKEDFFKKYNNRYIEVAIQVLPELSEHLNEEIYKTYGEHGENFSGPFVYEYEVFDPQHKLYAPVYIKVGDEKKKYAIETPDREPLPDDYGETDIWVDVEVVDNDHRFLYVEGKSNLMEGLMLTGMYYPDEDAFFPQRSNMYVEPDGTFTIPVEYDSITSEGYIEIQGVPVRSHRTKQNIYKAYGEDFENLTGDDVKKVDDHQEILLTIEKQTMDVETPQDSLVTEEDGELKIQVPDDVLFDFDKSDLKDSAKETLEEVIDILEELENGQDIQVNGHTDNEGDPDYNMKLSEERAASVENYLSKNGDVDHLNIEKKGYGETMPATSNEEAEGRERNRRVEIVFDQ